MGHRTLSVGLIVGTLTTLSASSPAASLPSRLTIEVGGCQNGELDLREAEYALRSELEADGVAQVAERDQAAATEATLSVEISCDAKLTAHVVLKSVLTDQQREQRFVVADAVRTARARALALTISEFLRSEWPDLNQPALASGTPHNKTGASAGADPDASENPAADVPARSADAHADAPREPKTESLSKPNQPLPPAVDSHRVQPHAAIEASGRAPPRSKFVLAVSARVRWFVGYRSLSEGGDSRPRYRSAALPRRGTRDIDHGRAWVGDTRQCCIVRWLPPAQRTGWLVLVRRLSTCFRRPDLDERRTEWPECESEPDNGRVW